jgi:hypothetical protein
VKSRPPYTCRVRAPFCQRDSVVPSHAVFTSEQTIEKPKKAPLCLTFSHAQDAFQDGDRAPHLVPPS